MGQRQLALRYAYLVLREYNRIMRRDLSIPKQFHVRKKVRGSKRKLLSFGIKLESILRNIPNEDFGHDKVWHYHLPNPSGLVDSTHSSKKLRKEFLQLLVDKLIELDDLMKRKYQALLLVSVPFLSQSRIDICVDSRYFEQLVDNTAAPGDWAPLSSGNIARELNLSLPNEYRVKGFLRVSKDSQRRVVEENWIIWKA